MMIDKIFKKYLQRTNFYAYKKQLWSFHLFLSYAKYYFILEICFIYFTQESSVPPRPLLTSLIILIHRLKNGKIKAVNIMTKTRTNTQNKKQQSSKHSNYL